MSDVNDIPDTELLRRAIRCTRAKRGGCDRWVTVSDRFALGSTFAQQLCRRFGFDPFEKVRRDR